MHIENLFINSKSNIEPQEIVQVQDPDSDKVHITIKQIVRDWTDLGSSERDAAYKPIMNEMMNHFTTSGMQKRNQFRVVSKLNYYLNLWIELILFSSCLEPA